MADIRLKSESVSCTLSELILIVLYLRGGGSKLICDIATSDFKKLPKLYFTPKLSHFGLKMIIRHFSSKFWKTILTPIFAFWGIPELQFFLIFLTRIVSPPLFFELDP